MDKKSNKMPMAIVIIIIGLLAVFGYFYTVDKEQKAPLERAYKIFDTDIYIKTTYNDKYSIGRLDITINEPVEDWQIKSIGSDKTDIELECETEDKTVKKEYEIKDIPLIRGQKITGNLIFENLTVNDYVMMKELLSGDIKINTSKYLTLNAKERDKLQQEFYKKEQDKVVKVKEKKAAATQKNSPSFFDTLFDF